MNYFSLFAGIGGFELGLSNSQCVGYSEIDKYAIKIYEKHFKHKNFGNANLINTRDLPSFDLLCAGFPCQSFSVAGRRRGISDASGALFYEIYRIAKEMCPRLLLLENVRGLLSHDNGKTFHTILLSLDELGYDVQWQVLNSKNFGVPQNRERVFIVGHLRGTTRPQVFPVGEVVNKHCPKLIENIGKGNQGQRIYSADSDSISITITATSGGLGVSTGLYSVNGNIRRLTPIECERLQGFPDNWTDGISDTQRYKLLGNAVTVNVIKYISRLLEAM